MTTNKPQEQACERPPGIPTPAPPPAVVQPGERHHGPKPTRPRLDQMRLISAILFEIDRQGIKTVTHDELNAVRIAADTVVAVVNHKRSGWRKAEGERAAEGEGGGE